MGIQDDIALTDPWLYYPLDAGDASDHGSNGHPGTVTGSFSWAAPGIEQDKTSLLLTGTGVITSTPLGLTDSGDFTIACYAALPQQAAWNAWRPLASIGVAGTTAPAAWGGGLGLNGPSAGVPTASGETWPTFSFAGGPASTIAGHYWHHFLMMYDSATHAVTCYLNGVAGSAVVMNSVRGAFKATDSLVVSWPGQIALTHLAFWRFKLTGAQISGIGGHTTDFPFDIPIDQTSGGSGGGGDGGTVTIGEPQATQITNIETHTNDIPGIVDAVNFISDTVNHIKGVTDATATDVSNIVNTLLPQLADVLNDIGASIVDVANRVTGTVVVGGTALVKTIGEMMSGNDSPPTSLLSYSGGITCSPIYKEIGGQRVYGIIIHITNYPADWEFRTPDNAWSLKDLAVFRLYDGGDLVLRHGIHTITHTIQPLPQRGIPWWFNLPPLQPTDRIVTVDWAPGVCGELVGIEAP